MSKKNYPEWGAFGTVEEYHSSQHKEQIQPQNVTDSGTQFDLTYEFRGVKITTEEKDTPEQIKSAINAAHEQAAKEPAPTLRGYKHLLRGAIENAIKNAKVSDLSQESVIPVWEKLVDIADSEQPGLMRRLTPKGIEYRGSKWEKTEGKEYDYYTRDALALAFQRERERDTNHSEPL